MFNSSLLNFLWTLLMIWAFVTVFWMFVQVVADIFRRENLSGWAKAFWLVMLMLLPLLGILVYMIVRPKNTEQDQRMAAEMQAAQSRLTGGSAVDDIAKAQELLDKGSITQAEFDSLKTKALA